MKEISKFIIGFCVLFTGFVLFNLGMNLSHMALDNLVTQISQDMQTEVCPEVE